MFALFTLLPSLCDNKASLTHRYASIGTLHSCRSGRDLLWVGGARAAMMSFCRTCVLQQLWLQKLPRIRGYPCGKLHN